LPCRGQRRAVATLPSQTWISRRQLDLDLKAAREAIRVEVADLLGLSIGDAAAGVIDLIENTCCMPSSIFRLNEATRRVVLHTSR
jgi:ABC-type cobalamin transport system permease subunit